MYTVLLLLQNGIANISTVSNDDGPEALLEGLLQAVVCKDLVGWRDDARKLILVFTDQRFHTAGDGKVHTYVHYVVLLTKASDILPVRAYIC